MMDILKLLQDLSNYASPGFFAYRGKELAKASKLAIEGLQERIVQLESNAKQPLVSLDNWGVLELAKNWGDVTVKHRTDDGAPYHSLEITIQRLKCLLDSVYGIKPVTDPKTGKIDYVNMVGTINNIPVENLPPAVKELVRVYRNALQLLLKRVVDLEVTSLQQIGWLVNVTYLHGNSTVIQLCRDYYDLGAENCPLDNEGNWKSDHPQHYMSKLTLSSSIVHRVKIQKVFAENELKSEVENESTN